MISGRWLDYFKESLNQNSKMSRDENTQVGCVIFSEDDKVVASSGWNCLARGVEHLPQRNQRPLKYKYTSHAEQSAIADAARMGRATKGMSLMVNLFPCTVCANMIVNSGIAKLYCPTPDYTHVEYGEDFKISEQIFKEAGVEIFNINF